MLLQTSFRAHLRCFVFILAGSVLPSCRSASNQPAASSTPDDKSISSIPPFQTREPARYQAVRISTFSKASGESVVTTTSIAKDGDTRRDEYENEGNKVVYLDLVEGRFILLPDAKLYASAGTEAGSDVDLTNQEDILPEISPNRLLNTAPVEATYQRVGSEVINGRNTSKYRVTVNSSGQETVSNGEKLIWIDEALGMPIKSEMVTADGDRESMELSKIVLDVDRHLFEIPADYKKVLQSAINAELKRRR